MQSARIKSLAVIGLSVLITMGFASTARYGGELSTCAGANNCAQDSSICTRPDSTLSVGPTTVSDLSDGVSSDGRGPYVVGTEGVVRSVVGNDAWFTLHQSEERTKNPRTLTVNLNKPVPGGGGVPLGIITGSDIGLRTQLHRVGNAVQNLHNIPVGQTVTAALMNVTYNINGQAHILQMGPLPNGHCYSSTNLVNGTGTSSGTIYRASKTKWVMDLPAGSVGRLFAVNNRDWAHAVDKGLYYVRFRYEIVTKADR